MKHYRCAFIILLLTILLVSGATETMAADMAFSTEALSAEETAAFLSNIHLTTLQEEPPKKSIVCFDVNEDGLIAVGCSHSEDKTICVYTSDGAFQYGYRFRCTGNFGVEFSGSVLMIYFVRSGVAAAVTPAGEVENVLAIQNTAANNTYWNHSVYATKREVDASTYTIRNDMGVFNLLASTYSQVVCTDPNGETHMVYDVNSSQFSRTLVVFFGALLFAALAVIFLVRKFAKTKNNS